MNVTLGITEAGTLVLVLGTIAAQEALKIKQIRQLGPNEAANITALGASATSTAQGTMDAINAWRAAHGLPALVELQQGQP